MTRRMIVFWALCVEAMYGQTHPARNIVFLGGGAGVPGGGLRSYMSSAGLVQFGYGYRLFTHLQADVGFIYLPGAAGIRYSLPTYTGTIQTGTVDVGDHEYMVPFGARGVLPLRDKQIELFAGAGGVYLRYAEEAASKLVACGLTTCAETPPCPQCRSRDGWGSYGMAGIGYSPIKSRRFWIEGEFRAVRGSSNGSLFGAGTRDQWLNSTVNLSYRF